MSIQLSEKNKEKIKYLPLRFQTKLSVLCLNSIIKILISDCSNVLMSFNRAKRIYVYNMSNKIKEKNEENHKKRNKQQIPNQKHKRRKMKKI